MLKDLEISKPEYLDILRNRGKPVSPSISYKLLKKVKIFKETRLNSFVNNKKYTFRG